MVKPLHFFSVYYQFVFTGLFFLVLGLSGLRAQNSDCDNLGFESGDLVGWRFYTGCHPHAIVNPQPPWSQRYCHREGSAGTTEGCCPTEGRIQNGPNADLFDERARHTLCGGVGNVGVDVVTNRITLVPPVIKGYKKSNYSLRLGNAVQFGESDKFSRTFTVTEDNAIMAYHFAFVLNDPGGDNHKNDPMNPEIAILPQLGLPFFEATILKGDNPNGTDTVDCTTLFVRSDEEDFDKTVYNGQTISYKQWTPVFVNLEKYMGEVVTMVFTNADCALGGHFGYSYVSAYCGPYKPMQNITLCINDTAMLVSPFSSDVFDLEWSTGETTDTIYVKADGNKKITLKVTNKTPIGKIKKCTDTYEVEITVGEGLPPVLEDTTLCPGEKATLVATPAGVQYEWYEEAVGGTPIFTGDRYVTDPIFTEVTYYVVNPAECAPKERIPVTVKLRGINVDAGEDQAVCIGGTVQLNASTGADTYSWKPTTFLDNPNIYNPKSTPNTTITYVVTAKSGACEATDTVTITIGELVADAGEDVTVCEGDTVQLQATGGAIYEWTPDQWLSDKDIANPLAYVKGQITYTVKVQDAAKLCEDTDDVTIFIKDIEANFTGTSVCIGFENEFTDLTGPADMAPFKWIWDFGDGGNSLEQNPKHTFPQPGVKDVMLVAFSGNCKDTVNAQVEVYPNPIAAFTPTPRKTTADDPSITFIDESEGAAKGTWDFGDNMNDVYVPGGNKIHVYYATNEGEGPFKYTITLSVESEHGCLDEVSHPIEIENIWTIYVPNSFTPDGDGINDYFKAYGIGIMEFKMTVFNRWGEAVYRSDDLNEGWDGTSISGNNKKQEVYVWKVKATNNKGKTIKLIGHVSLLPGPGN